MAKWMNESDWPDDLSLISGRIGDLLSADEFEEERERLRNVGLIGSEKRGGKAVGKMDVGLEYNIM